jgi:peptide/nickel transport system ATP-binding protein
MHVEADRISKAYGMGWMRRHLRPVLENINLSLRQGQRVGIVGRSGAGKTTLGLVLAGILKPDRGRLCLGDVDLWAASPRRRRRLGQQLQMVFQHPEGTFDPRWNLARSLAEPFILQGRRAASSDLEAMLGAVDLDTSLLTRRPAQLSGGELQRMAIARALCMQPKLLVIDEPTAMLDALTQARIIRLLENIQKERDLCMVLISHDPALVSMFCETLYRLKGSRLR